MASKDLTIRLLGDLSDLQKKLNQASNDLSRVGATMTKKVTPAAAAGAVALTKLGNDWNNAVDAIIIGTGASGEALDGLVGSAKNVANQVPNDFSEVGTAIAEVNTRLGLTGPELETTTKAFLDLSRVTGTDVKSNIGLVTRVFGDWSVASEDQAGALDTLFAATQQTGIGIDRLSSLVVQFGAPMRQLGFSMEESIAIFGKFEKEGVNIEAVMSGLRMGLGRMAKAGEDPIDTFKRLIQQIKDAGSQGEANAIALEGFGQRAGPDMAAAIREGRFEIDDLVVALGNTDGALSDAADRTIHLDDRLKMLKNRITGALGPFGELGGVASGAVAAMGPLLFGLGQMPALLSGVGRAFGKLKAVMMSHPLLTIGVVLGAAAIAMGVFGDSVDNSTTSVDNLSVAMRDAEDPLDGLVSKINELANESDVVLDVLDKAGVSTLDLAKAAVEGGASWDEMTARLRDAAHGMDGGVFAAVELEKTLGTLSDNTAEAIEKNEKFARINRDVAESTDDARESFEKATAASEDATDATEDQSAAVRDAGKANAYAEDLVKKHNAALEDQERAQEEATDAAREAVRVHQDQRAKLQDLIDTVNDSIDSTFDYERATMDMVRASRDYEDQLAETTAVLEDSEASARDKEDALFDLRDAEIGAAGEAWELAQAFAEEQGASEGSQEAARLQKEELQRLQDKFPFLIDEIQRYIDKLNLIPSSRMTTVGISTSGGGNVSGGTRGGGQTKQVFGAEGAIVNRRVDGVTLGEAGREAVIPLDKVPGNSSVDGLAKSLGGGGGTYNITINGFANEQSIQQLMRAIDEVEKRKRGAA